MSVYCAVGCFGISLRQQFEPNAVVSRLSGMCLQLDDVRPLTARHTVKQTQDFNTVGVTPSALFTRFGTQRLPSLLAPERHSTWTSLLIGCGEKRRGALVVGTAVKRRSFPRNLC